VTIYGEQHTHVECPEPVRMITRRSPQETDGTGFQDAAPTRYQLMRCDDAGHCEVLAVGDDIPALVQCFWDCQPVGDIIERDTGRVAWRNNGKFSE
jgi:hypothetical protein